MEERNDEWLRAKLDYMIETYFDDVDIPREGIEIKYGRFAKRQLGCIANMPDGMSQIRITKFFRDVRVPEYVIESTIAHELSHYSHGFNSPLPQKYRHPHKHGVVRKEFMDRDLHNLYSLERKWLRSNWSNIIEEA